MRLRRQRTPESSDKEELLQQSCTEVTHVNTALPPVMSSDAVDNDFHDEPNQLTPKK